MLAPYLRLVRAGTLFSPAADVIAGLCLAGLPWSWVAARAALASVCAYAGGMVLNDHADRQVDAVQRPERPIPSGSISPRRAFGLGLLLSGLAIVLSPWPWYHAGIVLLVLAYDYGVKSNALAGALAMGTLRGLNLAAGAATLTHAMPGDMVMIAAAAYAAYIAAVTLLGILEDDPDAKPRAILALQCVPPLAATLACLRMPQPWPAAAIAGLLALVFLASIRTVRTWDQRLIRRSMTWLLLGTMVYTALLCGSAGRWTEALAIAVAIAPARWISRRIALT